MSTVELAPAVAEEDLRAALADRRRPAPPTPVAASIAVG